MSLVYAIGDMHFGHKGISRKFRQEFGSDDQHNEVICQNIMNIITKRDTLWMLGDCFFTLEGLHYLRRIQIECEPTRVHWVLGNHDTQRKRFDEVVRQALREGLVDSLHGIVKYKGAWLSHAPIHPQELYGKVNIHGHVHRQTIPDDRYVNVSCENTGYKPILLDQILHHGWRGQNVTETNVS